MKNGKKMLIMQVDIFETDLDIYEKCLYMAICKYADKNGKNAWPSYATLASMCSMSRSGVIKVMNRLVEKGIVKKNHRFIEDEDSGTRRQTSNLFTLISKAIKPKKGKKIVVVEESEAVYPVDYTQSPSRHELTPLTELKNDDDKKAPTQKMELNEQEKEAIRQEFENHPCFSDKLFNNKVVSTLKYALSNPIEYLRTCLIKALEQAQKRAEEKETKPKAKSIYNAYKPNQEVKRDILPEWIEEQMKREKVLNDEFKARDKALKASISDEEKRKGLELAMKRIEEKQAAYRASQGLLT